MQDFEAFFRPDLDHDSAEENACSCVPSCTVTSPKLYMLSFYVVKWKWGLESLPTWIHWLVFSSNGKEPMQVVIIHRLMLNGHWFFPWSRSSTKIVVIIGFTFVHMCMHIWHQCTCNMHAQCMGLSQPSDTSNKTTIDGGLVVLRIDLS